MKGLGRKQQKPRGSLTAAYPREMAEDVEGSASHGEESRSEEDHVEEFQFGWNEDSVDLEFKTGHKICNICFKTCNLKHL